MTFGPEAQSETTTWLAELAAEDLRPARDRRDRLAPGPRHDVETLAAHALAGNSFGARVSQLELTARLQGETALADQIAAAAPADRPWRPLWARWRRRPPARIIGRPFQGIYSLAIGEAGDQTYVAAVSRAGQCAVWDTATLTLLTQFRLRSPTAIAKLAIGELDGQPVVITVTESGSLRSYAISTGEPLGVSRHLGGAITLASGLTQTKDRCVAATVDIHDVVHGWDITQNEGFEIRLAKLTPPVAIAIDATTDQIFVAVAGRGNTVRVVAAATGEPIGLDVLPNVGHVARLALGYLNGNLVVAVEDGSLELALHDARSGRRLGPPRPGLVLTTARPKIDDGLRQFLNTNYLLRCRRELGLALMTPLVTGAIDGRQVAVFIDETGAIRLLELSELPHLNVAPSTTVIDAVAIVCPEAGSSTRLLVASQDGVEAFAASTGVALDQFEAAPGETMIELVTGTRDDQPVVVARAKTGQLLARTSKGQPVASAISTAESWFGEGRKLFALDGQIASPVAEAGGQMCWRDVFTGEAIGQALGFSFGSMWPVGVLTVDDRLVALMWERRSTFRFWDPVSSRPISPELPIDGVYQTSVAADLDTGEPLVACLDHESLRVFDARGWRCLTSVKLPSNPRRCLGWVTIRGRRGMLALDDGPALRIWDASSGGMLAEARLPGSSSTNWAVLLSPHRQAVCVCLDDTYRVHAYDVEHSTWLALADRFAAIRDDWVIVGLGALGDRAACVVSDWQPGYCRSTWVVDVLTGETIGAPLQDFDCYMHYMALGEVCGRQIVAAVGRDSLFRVWDIPTGRLTAETEGPFRKMVSEVTVASHHGRAVAVCLSEFPPVYVVDASSGEVLGEPPFGLDTTLNAMAAAKIQDQRLVAAVGSGPSLELWDLDQGRLIAVSSARHASAIVAAAFGEIGGQSVVGSADWDGHVKFWSRATGATVQAREAHVGKVHSVAFGQLGHRTVAFTTAEDGQLLIHDVLSGDCLESIEFGAANLKVEYQPGGVITRHPCLVVYGADGVAMIELTGDATASTGVIDVR